MMSQATSLEHVVVESEIDALLYEANMIRKLTPHFNVNWKDGKAYPLIEITIKDRIPQVHIARSETNPEAKYFGPYPTGSDLKGLLRFLRKLFPYVSQNHPGNKPCLRSHLGLCPCPDVFLNNKSRLCYLNDLRHLREFLEGKRQTVQKNLTKEMLDAAKKKQYELAAQLKRKLQQLDYVTQTRTQPFEYEVNPNLIDDRHQKEISELEKILKIEKINKIECYDISNTSGKLATGAQVVFINGAPEKSLYRRYKINPATAGPDDYSMMNEIVSRRLKSEVPLPDLMIIDGGKGQLSSIPQTSVPTIALSKRLETIITKEGKEINLPEDSPALHLIQRLRDEAHRFGKKYHIFLRSRNMLTLLGNVP